MTADRWAEEEIRSWLVAKAPDRLRDDVLTATFEQTRQLAQPSRRRRWASRSMRELPIVFAAGAIVVVLVASSIGVGTRNTPAAPPADAPIGGPLAVQFGSTSQVTGQWVAASDVAATIQREPGDEGIYYWRAATYDRIDMNAWHSSPGTTIERPRGSRIMEGLADDVDPAGRQTVTFTVEPDVFRTPSLLSPATPVTVDRGVELTTVGGVGFFASLERAGNGPYTVTALVPEFGADPGMLNESALRAAGTDYPAGVLDLYTPLPGAVVGSNVARLRDEVLRSAESRAPYDIAQRLVEILRGPDYTYDTDVRDLDCGALSTAECFATFKRGYCQHYASTMAVVLRDLGIPARLVGGFLPGERTGNFEVIRLSAAHAWVEVYFPGFEWVAFDPTGGEVAQM